MTHQTMQIQTLGKRCVNVAAVLGTAFDRMQPVAGQHAARRAQAAQGLLDDLLPFACIEEVAHFAQHDEVKFTVRPILRHTGLLNADMLQATQALARQCHRLRVDVLAQQRVAALGQLRTEFTVGKLANVSSRLRFSYQRVRKDQGSSLALNICSK